MSADDFNKKATTSQFRREFFGLSADLRCDRCNRHLPSGWGHVEYEGNDESAPKVSDNVFGPVCTKKIRQAREAKALTLKKETVPLFVQPDMYSPAVEVGHVERPVTTKKKTSSVFTTLFNQRASIYNRAKLIVTQTVPKAVSAFVRRFK